jgi:uncharacterized protein YcfJ
MNHLSMKSVLALAVTSVVGIAAHAQGVQVAQATQVGVQPVAAAELGRVISSTAIISQVSVPRQVCTQEVVQVQNEVATNKSGAGALMGGIAGGAVGNAVGQGNGRAVATVIGIFAGAVLGDRIEGASPAQAATTQQTVNRCSTQNFYENRTTAYQVVYEYAGKQYSVQMPQDPGPTIQLQVSPIAPVLPAAPPPRVVSQEQAPVYVEQAPVIGQTVISSGAVYQHYVPPVVVTAPRYYYPRPVFGASFVIRGGHGGHGGHHHGHRSYHGGYVR